MSMVHLFSLHNKQVLLIFVVTNILNQLVGLLQSIILDSGKRLEQEGFQRTMSKTVRNSFRAKQLLILVALVVVVAAVVVVVVVAAAAAVAAAAVQIHR